MGKEEIVVVDDVETPTPELTQEPVAEIDVQKEMKDIEDAENKKLELRKASDVRVSQLGRLMDMIAGMEVPDGAKKAVQQAKSILAQMSDKSDSFPAKKSLDMDSTDMQKMISTAVAEALKDAPKTVKKSEAETPKTLEPEREVLVTRKGEGKGDLPVPETGVAALESEITAAKEKGGSGLEVLAEKGILFQDLK